MADHEELELRLDKVGGGPMFEVVLNNVRLDVTKAGPLYSLRVSGFVNDRQLETIKEMFTALFSSPDSVASARARNSEEV